MVTFNRVFKQNVVRLSKKEALHNSITAAKLIAERLSSILGPTGLAKLLIEKGEEAKCSTDAAIILSRLFIENPAIKILADAGLTTKREVGDGTASVVILTASLLEGAEKLLAKGIHPTSIINGYFKAKERVLELYDEMSVKVDPAEVLILKKIANTAANKISLEDLEHITDLIVKAIMMIAEKNGEGYKADIRAIKLAKQTGGSLADTKLITGSAIAMEVMDSKMPRIIEKANIALLDCPIQVKRTEYDTKVELTDPKQIELIREKENEMLIDIINKIVSAGATVVVNKKFIDELAGHHFSRHGIMAVRFVGDYDVECLLKATGGKLVKNLNDLTPDKLGYAELVEEQKIGEVKWIIFEGCKKPKSLTILIRGATPMILDMSLSAMGDALFAVRDVMRDPRIAVGGGALEMEVAMQLRKWALRFSGREQLAILAFAEALEAIPSKIAENCGIDSLSTLVELRARHAKGDVWAGIDALNGKIEDMMNIGVLEPVAVKEQVVKSACEAAAAILKIDEIIGIKRGKE